MACLYGSVADYVPSYSPVSREILITDRKSSEADDHRRVLVLRSEFIAVLACEETTLAELPLVLLSPLAEDTLFRAFPEPPLPVTIS